VGSGVWLDSQGWKTHTKHKSLLASDEKKVETINVATLEEIGRTIWVNSDGKIVSGYKAEWDAPCFVDYDDYMIPSAFLGWYF